METESADTSAVPKEATRGDWWMTGKFTADMNPHGLVEKSSFVLLFPSYRELYLKEVWPLVEATFASSPYFLNVELNAKQGNLAVETTDKTFDPMAVILGRDVLLLMARGMAFEHARKLLEPNYTYDIIKIKSFTRKYETFMNRRQRLLGPNGATLKALELLTDCHILIQGKTVSVVGPVQGTKEVRRVVIDCMENIHPIYHIKQLMVKRELQKNKALQDKDWSKVRKTTRCRRMPNAYLVADRGFPLSLLFFFSVAAATATTTTTTIATSIEVLTAIPKEHW